MSSGKWCPFCLSLNVLMTQTDEYDGDEEEDADDNDSAGAYFNIW